MKKTLLFIFHTHPKHHLKIQEGLDMLLAASTFEVEMIVIFREEGCALLQMNQPFFTTIKNLSLYGIQKIFTEKKTGTDEALVPVSLLTTAEVENLIATSHAVFEF